MTLHNKAIGMYEVLCEASRLCRILLSSMATCMIASACGQSPRLVCPPCGGIDFHRHVDLDHEEELQHLCGLQPSKLFHISPMQNGTCFRTCVFCLSSREDFRSVVIWKLWSSKYYHCYTVAMACFHKCEHLCSKRSAIPDSFVQQGSLVGLN